METQTLCGLFCACAALLFGVIAQAAATPEIGHQLSAVEMTALAKKAPQRVGDLEYRELTSTSLSTVSLSGTSMQGPVTRVVNAQGRVGESRNEVLIARVPAGEVEAKARGLMQSAVSVRAVETSNLTVLRFSSFGEAVRAYARLTRLFPLASVSVPVQYSRP